MDKESQSKINWLVMCIGEFARYKNIEVRKAFNYLNIYGGIKVLDECYEIEHTLSISDTIAELEQLCRRREESV